MYENKISTYLPGLHTNIVAYIHRDSFIEYEVLSEHCIINTFLTRAFVVLVCLYVGGFPCGKVQRSESDSRMFSLLTSLP